MTRHGKIARLPRRVRDQVNVRLEDGEAGVKIVEWLNAMPEVKEVLAESFGGRPINEQNLSDWKQGGYEEWLRNRETMDLARQLTDSADELADLAGGPLSDKVSTLLGATYMVIVRNLTAPGDGDAENWKRLRELCKDLVTLRKADNASERLKLDRERLQWA